MYKVLVIGQNNQHLINTLVVFSCFLVTLLQPFTSSYRGFRN